MDREQMREREREGNNQLSAKLEANLSPLLPSHSFLHGHSFGFADSALKL